MLFFMCFTYIRNLFDKRGAVELGGMRKRVRPV